MAAPADVTINDLNGTWTMDKTLSNDPDPIFVLQGMSWLTRTALSYAYVTLDISESTDEDGNLHIDIDQTVTGGIKGTSEHRILNWSTNEHQDHIFGTVNGQSRIIRGKAGEGGKVVPDLEMQTNTGDEEKDKAAEKFLRGEVLADGKETEGFLSGEGDDYWVQSWVVSVDNGWTAEQIWGFENVEGERRYTRRVVVAKDGQVEKVRLVYTFLGRKEQQQEEAQE